MEVKDNKEAIEFLENFLKNNPYPENIFTPIPEEDFTKINNLLKKGMGYPIDRLFGNMGRRVYQTIGEDLQPIIALLEQGEIDKEELKKYRQMWKEICKHYALMEFDKEGYEKGIKDHMELEQKYFPKEAKQDEADNKRSAVKQE